MSSPALEVLSEGIVVVDTGIYVVVLGCDCWLCAQTEQLSGTCAIDMQIRKENGTVLKWSTI